MAEPLSSARIQHPESASSETSALAQHFLETRASSAPLRSSPSLHAQMSHRLSLVSIWSIALGSRVLEIGCGQGDCSVVLADAVGPDGHVDAVDPGAADYGSPWTLSQAQDFISSGPLGNRITFHLSVDPLKFLDSYAGPKYDYIILCHCIWYFESPSTLSTLITALAPHLKSTGSLNIAEWSLRSMKVNSQAHVLTALLLSTIEAKRKIPGRGNVRTVLSPAQIISDVQKTGRFELRKEDIRESNEGLLDGHWEVSDVLRKQEKVLKKLGEEDGVNEKELTAIRSLYDAIQANVNGLESGVKGVKSMDVWVGKFIPI